MRYFKQVSNRSGKARGPASGIFYEFAPDKTTEVANKDDAAYFASQPTLFMETAENGHPLNADQPVDTAERARIFARRRRPLSFKKLRTAENVAPA